MKWTRVQFGKYKGQTLPYVVFHDPDYLFRLDSKGTVVGRIGVELRIIIKKMRRIVLKNQGADEQFAWFFGDHGHLEQVRLVKPDDWEVANSNGPYALTPCLDLRTPYHFSPSQKGAYRRLLLDFKPDLIGDGKNYTEKTCGKFFNNPANFLANPRTTPGKLKRKSANSP